MEINDQSRLLQLDFRALTDPVPDEVVDSYRTKHEVSDRESTFESTQLLFGPHPWLRRVRLDTFAQYNGLTYSPSIDPTPFTNLGFFKKREIYPRSVVDVLTTGDGQVTVASFVGPGYGRGPTRTKFVSIFLGHNSPPFWLRPRVTANKKATDELDRHFTFSGEGWDTSEVGPLLMPDLVKGLPPELKQRLPLDVQDAAEQEAKKGWWARLRDRRDRYSQLAQVTDKGERKLEATLFDAQLGQQIVREALGFTFEVRKTKLYVYRDDYSEESLIKPELIQQMFRIAALLGPPIARASRNQPAKDGPAVG